MNKVELEGSEREAPTGVTETRAADPDETTRVVVELRRKAAPGEPTMVISPEDYEARFGASSDDIETLSRIAADYHLSVASAEVRTRQVVLEGRLGDHLRMFGGTLREAKTDEDWFRYRTGSLEIPSELSGIVLSVSGLDTRPQVSPQLAPSPMNSPQFVLPIHIADFHGFRSPLRKGKRAIISILVFGGGFEVKDVMTSRALQGITEPLDIEAINVGNYEQIVGTTNHHREAALDIQVCSSVAPEAKLRIYFASRETSAILQALADAVHADETPTVITMSWGAQESQWSEQLRDAFDRLLEDAQHLGISFFAASGDNGPGRGSIDPEFPASSPRATACGGIEVISDHVLGLVPVAWNAFDRGMASGGGFSKVFGRPGFQKGLGHDFRCIPDVSGYAGLRPGYLIVLGGEAICLGATSAVAPLYAAFVACIAGSHLLPRVNERFYDISPDAFLDVTRGQTDLGRGVVGFVASAGWDLSTGLGCLIGDKAREKLRPFRVPRPSP